MTIARIPVTLPSRLPVFPLCGVVLMPFGHVPLNVFEPRYLQMIDDALGGPRLIALVQPQALFDDPVPDDAPLYTVGTVGRIISFQDSTSGHYQIVLEGISRFRVVKAPAADAHSGYRTLDVDFSPYGDDRHPAAHEDGPGRGRILALLRDYFTANAIDADWTSVSEAPYEALVSSLVMSCPFAPGEKQALLECENHGARAKMLISLFEMSLEGGTATGGFGLETRH